MVDYLYADIFPKKAMLPYLKNINLENFRMCIKHVYQI